MLRSKLPVGLTSTVHPPTTRLVVRALLGSNSNNRVARPHSSTTVRPSYDLRTRAHLIRKFSTSRPGLVESRPLGKSSDEPKSKAETKEQQYDEIIAQKEKQIRTPWHRDGSEKPPVSRPRMASAMTKGKLLSTPSRLMKLILPLSTRDRNSDRKDVEPLALLVHPQQPLSYLERLIQSELPTIKDESGRDVIPSVYFKAEDSNQGELKPEKKTPDEKDKDSGLEESNIEGRIQKTGVLNPKKSQKEADALRGGPGEGGVESYSGQGREGPAVDGGEERNFVKWSSSTDVGDFIRDAARGKEFAVVIEGAPDEIRVGVPSFNDRTHYLRHRLRRASRKIADMAAIKKECDDTAHRGAQNVAMGGFGALVTWWIGVYYLTFQTSLGWDVMEPVTYLVGLNAVMAGYLWFLYHNREVSYRAALNVTISRRQNKLYQAKGFDVERWESLIEEGNSLRKEIKIVASTYDVDWDEKKDEKDDSVVEALRKEREKKKEASKDKDDKDDKDDDDEKKKKKKET